MLPTSFATRHDDPVDGVLGDVAVRRDDHDDRLTDVVDLVLGEGERRPRRVQRGVRDEERQRLTQGAGQVLVRVDRDDPVDVKRKPDQVGFAVQPRRWVVERFFAWISRNRRL